MGKALHLTGALLLTFCMCGFMGGIIDSQPQPIVWGNITFTPASTVKSPDQTVMNKVTFSGYGKKGTIEKITINNNETILENITSDFYTAKRVTFRGYSGQYMEALEFYLSDGHKKIYQTHSISGIPKFNVEFYEAIDSTIILDPSSIVTVAYSRSQDLSYNGMSNSEASDITLIYPGNPQIKIASASLTKCFIPDDVDKNPEKIVLSNFQANELSMPALEARIENINLDYDNSKLKFGIEKASVPSAILDELHIPNLPAMLQGSLNGEGQLDNNEFTANANLDLANLIAMKADISGNIKKDLPSSINFTITDKGIISSISEEMKSQLMMYTVMVPNGQAALVSFLAHPDQTLNGSITFSGSQPDFTFSVQ